MQGQCFRIRTRVSVSLSPFKTVSFVLHVDGAQELCESRDGCPGLPVPNKPYGLCGRKATVPEKKISLTFPMSLCTERYFKLVLLFEIIKLIFC